MPQKQISGGERDFIHMSFSAFRNTLLALTSAATVTVYGQLKWEGCADLSPSQFKRVPLISRNGVGSVTGVTVRDANLMEPVKLSVAKNGDVYFVERGGTIKIWKTNGTLATAGKISVFTGGALPDPKKTGQTNNENGLHGIVLDPNFETNKWLYVHYSPLVGNFMNISRWTMNGDQLDMSSEKVLLQIPIQRNSCCHTGGGMEFDASGNLFVTVGNNTTNPAKAAADAYVKESDPDADDQGHAANTNDLRGKILRIKPTPDGQYTIPAGNLFPPNTDKARGEIYAMGLRNPYSLAVDRYRGWIAWGDVGPDDGLAYSEEWNVLTAPAFAGWPYFVGNNQVWRMGKNPSAPINNSPNNTGLTNLPPAVPAMIGYPQRCAITGPFYHYDGANPSTKKMPPHLNKKWIVSDWWDGFLEAVTLSEDGKSVVSRNQFRPRQAGEAAVSGILDIKVGPDGALYLVEYGQIAGGLWFKNDGTTAISRIEYTGTCHPTTPTLPTSIKDIETMARGGLVGSINLGLRRDVDLPAGARGFRLYDVQGKLAWEYKAGGDQGSGKVAVPASVGSGVLRIKYLR
jgi:cytochrome c